MIPLKPRRVVVIAGACFVGALALLGCSGLPVGKVPREQRGSSGVRVGLKSSELSQETQAVAMADPSMPVTVESEADTESGEPIIVCDDPVYDAGTFWVDYRDPYIRHEFLIKNIGTGTAWVVVVRASSGTRPKPCFKIKPGGVLRLPFKLRTRNLPRSNGGKFSKVITVRLVPPPGSPHCRACGYPKHWHKKPCDIRPNDIAMP